MPLARYNLESRRTPDASADAAFADGSRVDSPPDASPPADAIADDGGASPTPAPDATDGQDSCPSPIVTDDTARGRLRVQNDVLDLEFGYKTHASTNNNQSGGNLYHYVDERFDASDSYQMEALPAGTAFPEPVP